MRVVGCGLVAVALLMAGCGGSGSDGGPGSQPSASTSRPAAMKIVALGDSDATGIGDATGRGWVGRYGDLAKQKLKMPVTVDNRAGEGKTSDQLLTEVTDDDSLRQALKGADVLLVGIGGADLSAGDDALGAGSCEGRQCYAQLLQAFDANIKAIASEVRRLAPTAVLRAISLPNVVPGGGDAIPSFVTADIGRYQVVAERASICQAMRSNGGQCVDVVRAFNGDDASGDAYMTGLLTKDPCCYPSATGQQLMAELVAETGFQGLHTGT
jgi:lysophospholipase L1-like esterase